MANLLHVLIVDDSENDAKLIVRKLRSEGYEPQWERVDTADTMKAALNNKKWDVILCDFKMPLFSVYAALKILQEEKMDIPFILISGAIGEDTAMAAVKSGANDYVMKGNLSRLAVTIEKEISKSRDRQENKNND